VPSPLTLVRAPRGGFRLEGRGRSEIRALPGPEGFVVRGGGVDGWLLERPGGDVGAGFILRRGAAPEAPEAARSMRPWDSGVPATAHFLTGEGRVYRMVFRGGSEGGLELRSWEVPGAYWKARPSARGFRLTRTVAGRELPDETALLVLFAAEVLETQEPLAEPSVRGKKGKRKDARRA